MKIIISDWLKLTYAARWHTRSMSRYGFTYQKDLYIIKVTDNFVFYGLWNNIKLGLIVNFLTLLLEGPSNYSLVNETSFLQIWTTESRVGAVWRVDPLSGRQATCSASANPAPALHWQNRKFAKNCTTISNRFLTSISLPEQGVNENVVFGLPQELEH